MPFRGQWFAGRKCSVEHQDTNPVSNFLGHARLFDGRNQPRFVAGSLRDTLDSVARGWYSLVVNWFNHWASVPHFFMSEKLFEFMTPGSPRAVSGAIEQLALGVGSLTAIIVPWESDGTTLCMAVTSTQGEGWALEHTNLGTIRLADQGNETTRVEVLADIENHPENQRLSKLFARFSSELQNRLQVTQ